MAEWGKNDQANNAPKFITNASTGQTGIEEFGTKVFGVSANEATAYGKGAATGWVRVVKGTGALVGLTVENGGTGYANTDTINIVNTAGANGAGSITTDETGVITSVVVTDPGSNFDSSSPTVEITTTAGTGATITAQVGGRAGRTTIETLVAMNEIIGDAPDDSTFPDS